MIEKEAEKVLKYKHLTTEIQRMWSVKKSDRGNWNVLRATQTKAEQHTGKGQNQGTTENSHIGHSTHTAESANVKVQNIQHGK